MRERLVQPTGAEGGSVRLLTLPNVLTVLRLLSVPVFVWLFSVGREDQGFMVFLAAAATDFLDGYLARRTHSASRLGALLDPLADRVFVLALAGTLLARGSVPASLAWAVLSRDLLLLAGAVWLGWRNPSALRVGSVGKVATAYLLAGLTLFALGETGFSWGKRAAEGALGLSIAGAALYWWAALGYARRARQEWQVTTEGR